MSSAVFEWVDETVARQADRYIEVLLANRSTPFTPVDVVGAMRDLLLTPEFEGYDPKSLASEVFRVLEQRCIEQRIVTLVTLGQGEQR